MKIGAIILAAGFSKRMGSPKVFFPFQGKSMFLHSVELAIQTELSPIYVVGGKYIEKMKSDLNGLPVTMIKNEESSEGMSTSLKLGVNEATGKCDAVIVFLADQPLVPKAVIGDLIDTYSMYSSDGIKIIRPMYHDIPGHPILFDTSLFKEFASIDGDEGGRVIIQCHKQELKWVHYDDRDWGKDIDTIDDYHWLIRKYGV
ncbi:nucleotidyltransferase family protein [Bacillus canaveralius]|uniref:nucleotidyltransferase family protein n=1 Tax=Bacillus canaveralius TaxID=1403243 RepID=UPI000F789B43|nr:nucleotidyltransferase family protein [Bacillus canaveralius]RSK55131.1 nucleotidyltransferase family protein [Bacillus canaveralius]